MPLASTPASRRWPITSRRSSSSAGCRPRRGHLLQEIELRTALCVALVSLEMYSGPRMLQEYARLSGLCQRAGVSPGPPAMRMLAIALLM